MKQTIEALILQAVETLKTSGVLDINTLPSVTIERCRDAQHGDFATNLALLLAKPAKTNPRQLAEKILAALPAHEAVTKVEIAGPGFINFFINPNRQYAIIPTIHELGRDFGLSTVGEGKKVQVEFVSANPTGPLHVGHGRGAAYGSVVADLLQAVGFEVHREYYVNDAGRQMDILATSIWLRYLEECGEVLVFPSNGYRGDYVREIAWKIHKASANQYHQPIAAVLENIPADEPQGGDKDVYIDALIERAKTLLGLENYREVFQVGLQDILQDIKVDLSEFGVDYQHWFSEQQLMD
ncbi:MAG: arginine--tRNA ligase, partial [Methylococcaceae bacterium]|nr:arginine--tRNA ligase [Methylococcaceae bacterium]